jgi:hypothetical protein
VSRDYEHVLRWYPAGWRDRYGDEMTALLHDTYAAPGRIPLRARLGLARAGLEERAREAGVLGPAGGPSGRVRGGSLLVLCAFSLFVVGGAVFAKFTDQWSSATPRKDLTLPTTGFDVVVVTAAVAGALVLTAAALAVPALVRLLRAGRWHEVRGPVVRAVLAGVVAAAFFGGTVGWSRHLSVHDRNGGLAAYSDLFVVLCLAVVVAIALGTAAAVAVARKVELGERTVRALGRLALGVAAALVLIFGGVVAWWAAEVAHAPSVMANGLGNGVVFTSDTVPPTLLAAGLLMLAGLALAAAGSVRVLRALRHPSATG